MLRCLLLLIIPASLSAQSMTTDSSVYQQTLNNTLALYNHSVKQNSHLYNGSEYLYSGHGTKGFPYFESADTLTGSVYYDGNLYTNVPLRYDLTTDELVIIDYTKNYPIKLLAEKTYYFIADGHTFINASKNEVSPFVGETGFYQLLYNNKTSLYARKYKTVITRTVQEGFADAYKQYNKYYLYKNEKLSKVNNEKQLLNILKKKAQLRRFIKAKKINFKKDFENAMIQVTTYFDQLKN